MGFWAIVLSFCRRKKSVQSSAGQVESVAIVPQISKPEAPEVHPLDAGQKAYLGRLTAILAQILDQDPDAGGAHRRDAETARLYSRLVVELAFCDDQMPVVPGMELEICRQVIVASTRCGFCLSQAALSYLHNRLVVAPGASLNNQTAITFVQKVVRDHNPEGCRWAIHWEYGTPDSSQTIANAIVCDELRWELQQAAEIRALAATQIRGPGNGRRHHRRPAVHHQV